MLPRIIYLRIIIIFFMGLNMTNFRLNVLAYSVMLGLTAGVAYAAQPTNQPTNQPRW